ncbi:hypothetical protein EYF80_010073 [Liparis tanakae]|uniref:Uncharacterized protein n=1 Tax=Liparis tanakae TaxID=230148 RepID=A0A4Z2INV1_9TELE|nr:hypothetical protein EYF80_010073 [Liparis tanakae]
MLEALSPNTEHLGQQRAVPEPASTPTHHHQTSHHNFVHGECHSLRSRCCTAGWKPHAEAAGNQVDESGETNREDLAPPLRLRLSMSNSCSVQILSGNPRAPE